MDLKEEDNVFSAGDKSRKVTEPFALQPTLMTFFLKGQVKMLLMYSSKEEVGKLNCFVN